jgi:hypothetical protein
MKGVVQTLASGADASPKRAPALPRNFQAVEVVLMTLNFLRAIFCLSALVPICSCSSGTTATTTSSTNAYATAYASAKFNDGSSGTMTVSFPSECSMTVTGTGFPYQHQTYYLTPVMNGGTVVATTPSGIQLGVSPYAGSGLSTSVGAIKATFNTCPTKATSTTATQGGAIGLMFSGTVLFDAYEATSTVALGDNASYTFTSGGTSYTAYFLDPCNQHTANGGGSSSTWHYHGVPTCWTSVVDGTSGPSHIIGIALDGYPIYGGYDANGKAVDPSTLDACNGITSATPEFPDGAYHYVLPINTTTKQSSINCYTGTVSATLSAQMQKLGCKMPMLLADGKARLPDGREVSRAEASAWMQQTMPGMQMGAGMQMASTAEPVKETGGKRRMKMSGM